MPRIAGINVPNDKCIGVALTYIYGVGESRSKKILDVANVKDDIRAKDLDSDQILRIRQQVQSYKIEGDLRRQVQSDVRRLKEIGTYRGARHKKGLPVRGQSTKNNNRTVRGNRRMTMGSGRTKDSKT